MTVDQNILVCDIKLNVDDNAHYRQQKIFSMEDITQKNWK